MVLQSRNSVGYSDRFKAVAGELGLEEIVAELGHGERENVSDLISAEQTVSAMQMVLSNIMLVSALLLGFIVTGTLLSIGLTGKDNFDVIELIQFFFWSSLAAMFAFVSLITSFLTSVSGAHRLTASGPLAAAEELRNGSVLRRIAAEGGLYLSMLFFLVSLNQYIWMVYSGPDICPTYRGSASFCARVGVDLYSAGATECLHRCGEVHVSDDCSGATSMWDCLCSEVCKYQWEEEYAWPAAHPPHPGVNLSNYHFFAYRSLGPLSKPAREKVMTASSSLMCNHRTLESEKEACFADHLGDCGIRFMAWKQAEECMENSIQDALQCSKVCAWTHGKPPREALKEVTDWAFIPLGCMLLLLTFGRVMVITLRACVVVGKHQSRFASRLRNICGCRSEEESVQDDDDEESDSHNVHG